MNKMKLYTITLRHNLTTILECKAVDEEYARNKACLIENLRSDCWGQATLTIKTPDGEILLRKKVWA